MGRGSQPISPACPHLPSYSPRVIIFSHSEAVQTLSLTRCDRSGPGVPEVGTQQIPAWGWSEDTRSGSVQDQRFADKENAKSPRLENVRELSVENYPFLQSRFIEDPLCARHCAGGSSNSDKCSHPCGNFILAEEAERKKNKYI